MESVQQTKQQLQPSQLCYDMIKRWESLRLRAYKAVPGEKFYTIGYGHYSPSIKRNQVITYVQADEYLKSDVAQIVPLLNDWCPNLKQIEFDSLLCFIFNVGWYSFRHNMVGLVARDYSLGKSSAVDVTNRMVQYVRAGGKVLLGLQRRRMYEANMFLEKAHYKIENGVITTYN